MSVSFNPRARDGREYSIMGQYQGVFVSIHAPVMDANDCQDLDTADRLFQSTRP